MLWSSLGRRNRNPGQPMKLAFGLYFLAIGYVFMVAGSIVPRRRARLDVLAHDDLSAAHHRRAVHVATDSPSYPRIAGTQRLAAARRLVPVECDRETRSAGQVAGSIEAIESGDISLPWYGWFKLGGQADFFLMFVVISVIAGTIMLLLKPLLERLLAGRRA